jgi:hypothetical protein
VTEALDGLFGFTVSGVSIPMSRTISRRPADLHLDGVAVDHADEAGVRDHRRRHVRRPDGVVDPRSVTRAGGQERDRDAQHGTAHGLPSTP